MGIKPYPSTYQKPRKMGQKGIKKPATNFWLVTGIGIHQLDGALTLWT